MSQFKIPAPRYRAKYNRKPKLNDSSNDSSDDDYVDPAVEKEYYRQVRESGGFDVDGQCPLPYGGISANIVKDKYDYPYNMGLYGRLGLHSYNLQKGTNLELIGINKYNEGMLGASFLDYITLEAMDTCNNSPCSFQTCVCREMFPEEASLVAHTQVSRLKGDSQDAMRWDDEAIDVFYKGKLPNWLTKDELAAATDKGQYYELQESELQANGWLHLYAEFAFCYGIRKPFLPLHIKKVIIQTKESGEESPRMKLKTSNAIFYISFMGSGDPSGMPVEYQAIVRRTMDGLPGHIRLEVDRLAPN